MKRKSGILLAVSSLPGPYGIGTMGRSAYTFVDQLESAAQHYWQVLPLSPTGTGNSPYQSVSAFAGNIELIDFDLLADDGLLTAEEIDTYRAAFAPTGRYADFDAQKKYKAAFLRPAYERGKTVFADEINDFCWENAHWIHDYALYMAISESVGSFCLADWPEELRTRERSALMRTAVEYADAIGFHIFCQFIFYRQWDALKAYANAHDVEIIGDMPFYVSGDSADRWANSACFDREGLVAGCPPDYFAPEGQLWGNPIYNWEAMRADGYRWWMRRVGFQLAHFDLLRIDHFRGFEAYFAIPGDAETAIDGHWVDGPGDAFMETLKRHFDINRFIAEDLGSLTPSFFAFMQRHGLPGLKVLQFAFSPDEDSIYLPHNHVENSIVYTGTHDNDTALGWYKSAPTAVRTFAREYFGALTEKNVVRYMMRAAYMSVAKTAIVPMQDVLELDSDCRMNTPSTVGGTNWAWRLEDGEFDEKLCQMLARSAKLYGRA